MTTQMPAGKYEFICNDCGTALNTGLSRMETAWMYATAQGWRRAWAQSGHWIHHGPCCNRGAER